MENERSILTGGARIVEDVSLLSPLRRLTDPAYGDGISTPRPSETPADRVAFELFSQGEESIESALGLSALWVFWGQFLDHDLDLTPEQEGAEAEVLKPAGPFAPAPVARSIFVPEEDGPRQQINTITPLIDASNVYGSDSFRTLLLRSFEGGRMQSQPGPDGVDLLPDELQLFIPFADYVPTEEGFQAGDVRARENPGLTAIHSLWLNEHNHWADRFAAQHPDWTDDDLFTAARVAVEALIQQITYEEFLPLLIGDALAPYAGHDLEADPQISNEFATAAYRFGHTSIPDGFVFLEEDGATAADPLALFETFENDAVLLERGVPDLLRGLLETRAQEIDTKVVDSLNFLLFTEDGGLTGFSLPERNILRGRDHGLDTWLAVRAAVLGDVDAEALAGSTDFSVITADTEVQARLASLYGTLGEVDLWVGGLAEDRAEGAAVGPTFQAILSEQFTATRDGDPAFYLGREYVDAGLEAELRATTFADVLMRSGGIEHVQLAAFLASERTGGTEDADYLKGSSARDLLIGLTGDDYLKAKAGDDDLFGDGGDDMLRGGAGADALSGGAGRDKLMGEGGDDHLSGGDGMDLLIGGPGADVYVFVAGEIGMDSIAAFEDGADRVELRGFGASPEDVAVVHQGFMATLTVRGETVAEVWGSSHWGLSLDDIDLIG